jgi:HKD family nuclease
MTADARQIERESMNVEFFDSRPHEKLEPMLRSLVAGARRLDAAIAFVTPSGTRVLREFLKAQPGGNARLVVSVRFPTNLTEVASLSELMPGKVFIHTGFQVPEEFKADRGQFHSKVVLIECASDERCIIVGSHNWTENALAGHNLEAATIIRCRESDSIVAQVREHIESCVRRAEPFDTKRLRFYQTVQSKLHTGPSASDSEDFPGFEPIESLVIHAEIGTSGALPDPMQLFVPIREPVPPQFFGVQQTVLLFLYPRGALRGNDTPTETPTLLEGRVTMNNVVTDAPVNARQANCRLDDLRHPVIDLLPGNVPAPSGEHAQVIIRLNNHGPEPVPLFHAAQSVPLSERAQTTTQLRNRRQRFLSPVGRTRHRISRACPRQDSEPVHLRRELPIYQRGTGPDSKANEAV